MKPNFRRLTMAYLVLLGATLGAVLYAGIVGAPVIFNSEQWLGSKVLSHFQEGLIMTENFVRLSKLILVVILAVVLYEGYAFKMGERDRVTILSALAVLASALLFNYYYMPDILAMQQGGEAMTQSQAFINTHKGSEIDFKIFAVALLVLMVRTMQKACK